MKSKKKVPSRESFTPNFQEFARHEERILSARLDGVRAALSHGGEKGRVLEEGTRQLVRSFLPSEYGLSSGFIAYRDNIGAVKLSKQLDIIVFDAVHGAPLMSFESCDVFPLEAVYAYVEVKATLARSSARNPSNPSSLERCLHDNGRLRKMRYREYWHPNGGSPSTIELVSANSIAIRSYLFAYEARPAFATLKALAQRVSNTSVYANAHMHGVFAADLGFLYTKPIDPHTAAPEDWYHTSATSKDALLLLKTSMMQALATFPRPPKDVVPAVDGYYKLLPNLEHFQPQGFYS